MWRAARALISCYYTTLRGASSPDEISNNLNNISDLKFYRLIRGNLENHMVEQLQGIVRHAATNMGSRPPTHFPSQQA
jgi:hypothetical protein